MANFPGPFNKRPTPPNAQPGSSDMAVRRPGPMPPAFEQPSAGTPAGPRFGNTRAPEPLPPVGQLKLGDLSAVRRPMPPIFGPTLTPAQRLAALLQAVQSMNILGRF